MVLSTTRTESGLVTILSYSWRYSLHFIPACSEVILVHSQLTSAWNSSSSGLICANPLQLSCSLVPFASRRSQIVLHILACYRRSPFHPLPRKLYVWILSKDFPRSGSANALLVVVDKLSKFAHFIPLWHPFTALAVAKLFMDNIYRLHVLPSAIIFDKNWIFTCNFWKTLFSLSGTEIHMSSA
jgi:hypothetical protein